MKRALAALCALFLLSCGSTEDRRGLERRPLSPATESGWARLPLDGAAQRHFPDLWLGDAEGNAIPYLVEREGLWEPRHLELARLVTGRDAEGHPTAEFVLKFPEGWQTREREHLRLKLDMEGAAPWVCAVKVQRRLEGGRDITLEREQPLHLFDLGPSGRSDTFSVPWDAQTYRVTLLPAQGGTPRIKGLTVTALTEPSAMAEDERLAPRRLERQEEKDKDRAMGGGESWLATLDAPERTVGLEIALKPPVAPIRPLVRVPLEPAKTATLHGWTASYPPTYGLVWNLPALHTASTRVSIIPTLADRLEIGLPEGAQLLSAKLLVKREVLLFPAEAGARYFLHAGGAVKQAPGSLAALPDSSRAVYARDPIRLGPQETDPQGVPLRVSSADRAAATSRPWLPWIAGAVVLALGYAAWRLLKGSH